MKNILEKEPLIICERLFVYPMEDEAMQFPLLQDVSLTIYKSDWIQLYGWNGSGKSTLLKILSGSTQYRVEGNIQWLGDDQTDQTAILIPIVQQQPGAGLIGASAWEDIVLLLEQYRVPEKTIIPLTNAIIRRFAMTHFSHLPLEHLSGGQLQLAAIAGAAAVSNHLLLMDEVTAMLDSEMVQLIMEQLRTIHNKQKTAVVWATQKEDEIMRTDRVLVVQQGQVTDEGSAEQWFTRNKQSEEGSSRCEQLQFAAPLYVQLFWQLQQKNSSLQLPFSWNELIAEVTQTNEHK
ncbi:ATP-binding cassette domain-containing protein [Paenibacillus yanchengensis]|uniref:ATP-binding cassette domain-containing protein n=1 Tax=Paenibacillus yanchengensis TaxID=2035833 RepID=A0ABW4YMQ7_9BACL